MPCPPRTTRPRRAAPATATCHGVPNVTIATSEAKNIGGHLKLPWKLLNPFSTSMLRVLNEALPSRSQHLPASWSFYVRGVISTPTTGGHWHVSCRSALLLSRQCVPEVTTMATFEAKIPHIDVRPEQRRRPAQHLRPSWSFRSLRPFKPPP